MIQKRRFLENSSSRATTDAVFAECLTFGSILWSTALVGSKIHGANIGSVKNMAKQWVTIVRRT
eukprot:3681539-Amphidinium_carterae.3